MVNKIEDWRCYYLLRCVCLIDGNNISRCYTRYDILLHEKQKWHHKVKESFLLSWQDGFFSCLPCDPWGTGEDIMSLLKSAVSIHLEERERRDSAEWLTDTEPVKSADKERNKHIPSLSTNPWFHALPHNGSFRSNLRFVLQPGLCFFMVATDGRNSGGLCSVCLTFCAIPVCVGCSPWGSEILPTQYCFWFLVCSP